MHARPHLSLSEPVNCLTSCHPPAVFAQSDRCKIEQIQWEAQWLLSKQIPSWPCRDPVPFNLSAGALV